MCLLCSPLLSLSAAILQLLMEEENKEEKEVELHPDSRRWGPPAFPHKKPPGGSQNLERGNEGCAGGGGSQLEHWQLLKQEGILVQAGGKPDDQLLAVCAELLQLHRDGGGTSQMLVARMLESLLKLWARMVKTQAGA